MGACLELFLSTTCHPLRAQKEVDLGCDTAEGKEDSIFLNQLCHQQSVVARSDYRLQEAARRHTDHLCDCTRWLGERVLWDEGEKS